MNVRIHRFGRDRSIDAAVMTDCDAFVLKSHWRREETIYIVETTQRRTIPVLNHETLHLVLDRIGEHKADDALDRVSNSDAWLEHGNLGGL